MRAELSVDEPIIDLGAVSTDTKGEPNVMPELSAEQPKAGLTD